MYLLCVAKPKSINLISNSLLNTKFSHLISLCAIPFKCIYSIAKRIIFLLKEFKE